jgi:hypothetical protein
MDSLLVLGLVPGTDIQITFFSWLCAALCLVALLVLLYVKRRHIIMFLLLALQIRRQVAHVEPRQIALTF